MRRKIKSLIIVIILLMSIGTAYGFAESYATGNGGGGAPRNAFIDDLKNKLAALSISISCPGGYKNCYEQENTYGNARAVARVYTSEPYWEGRDIKINVKSSGSGTQNKAYEIRGITNWNQVSCNSNGCSSGTYIGGDNSYTRTIEANSDGNTEPIAYVVWVREDYGGWYSWTWVGVGWLNGVKLTPLPTYTSPPPPPPVVTTPPPSYQCSDGRWVSNPAACPTPVITIPPPPPNTGCKDGEISKDGKCIKIIPDLPGFEILFAIAGITAIVVLRRKNK